MNFDNFQIQKWISQPVRAQKVDEENGIICLVSFFAFWVMALKLPKIVLLLQFFADASKKSKAVTAIYVYTSESSGFVHLENSTGYYAMI